MQGGKLIVRNHPKQHYRTVFQQKTGFFVRKEESGFPEPTWAEDGPELIDLSITSFCRRKCSFCYRGANDVKYQHLGMDDIVSVVEQAAGCGTLQIALGGGNPNQHPQFTEILKLIREYDIIPSYTSNGEGLSDMILQTTADCCGAMALSLYSPYDQNYYASLIHKIRSYGIKVNVHAIVHKGNISLWTDWLNHPPHFLKEVNAIIFLNYKPIGNDRYKLCLNDKDSVRNFFFAADNCNAIRIGFDSCSVSGIAKWMHVPDVLVESCEAARFSAFVNENMKMYPCSFMSETNYYGDLREQSLVEIWKNNSYFKNFRNQGLVDRCIGCSHLEVCNGGCKFLDEINFCDIFKHQNK